MSGAYGSILGAPQPPVLDHGTVSMWSVNCLPNTSLDASGICFGVVVFSISSLDGCAGLNPSTSAAGLSQAEEHRQRKSTSMSPWPMISPVMGSFCAGPPTERAIGAGCVSAFGVPGGVLVEYMRLIIPSWCCCC